MWQFGHDSLRRFTYEIRKAPALANLVLSKIRLLHSGVSTFKRAQRFGTFEIRLLYSGVLTFKRAQRFGTFTMYKKRPCLRLVAGFSQFRHRLVDTLKTAIYYIPEDAQPRQA